MTLLRKTCHDYLEEFGAGALALECLDFVLVGLFFAGFWMVTP